MIQLYHSLEYTQGLGSLLQTYLFSHVCFVPICNCWVMETYVLSYIPKMLYIYSIAYYKWNNSEEKNQICKQGDESGNTQSVVYRNRKKKARGFYHFWMLEMIL